MKIFNWIKANPWLTGIIIFGGVLRFYRIDYQSVWLDELHTINESSPSNSLGDLYTAITNGEQMPPLYFYSVYFLFKIFGYTTFVVRMYSAFLGVGSIYAFYILGKELFDKKTGIIGAFLLSVNYFHLFYSQESRPYIFLFLFGILSFYRLIVFIKNPTRRNALFYAIFAAILINSHFFGLFALLSQYFILMFFWIISEKEARKAFFINALISGIVTGILFLPAVPILIKVSQIKEFWIPFPTLDIYTLIFKEFFGNSEILLTLVSILILFYFLRIAKEKDFRIQYKLIVENKTIFSFTILIPWIIIVILIPLIRSYTSIPMLISRYFILVLPAILLILAAGISQFKNRVILFAILTVFMCFSFTDIVVIKKYYHVVNKTQFREVTQFISENNKSNEPVVTSLGWYFPYFLNNDKVKMTIVNSPLDDYVQTMIQDSTKRKPFWYVDAHIRPYNVNEATQKYLDENFIIQDGIDLYDTWTRHYVRTTNSLTYVNLSKYNPLQLRNGNNINFVIEKFDIHPKEITTSGWAYITDQEATGSELNLILINETKAIKVRCQKVIRDDVTTYINNSFDLSNSGFSTKILLDKLPAGKYQIGIQIKNNKTNKEGLVLSDKFFTK